MVAGRKGYSSMSITYSLRATPTVKNGGKSEAYSGFNTTV